MSDSKVAPGNSFNDLQRVKLRYDMPGCGLLRGECGTVVYVLEGADAYLVEFVDPDDGSTRAMEEYTLGSRGRCNTCVSRP